MDFFPSAEGGGVETFRRPAYSTRRAAGQVGTHITQGIYNNMAHLATNMFSKDVFDKATFNKVNI